MKKYLRIRRQVGVSYLSLGLNIVFAPILIFLLTRNLSVSEYGVYSILMVTASFSAIVLDLGFSQYIITKLSGADAREKRNSFFSIYLFEIISSLILISIFALIRNPVLKILKMSSYGAEFIAVLFIIFFYTLLRMHTAYFTAGQKLELRGLIAFLQQSLWIILVIIYFVITKELMLRAVVLLWISGVFLTWLFAVFAVKKELFAKKKIGFEIMKRGLSFGLPLLPFIIGSSIISVSDRYILNHYSNPELVGIYSLGYSLINIILTLGTIVPVVLYPYIAEAWNNKKDYNILFNISAKYTLMIILPSIIGVFVLKEQIISLISGPQYLSAAVIFPILVFFPLLGAISYVLQQSLLLRDRTKTVGAVFLTGGVINIILNLILIPKYFMVGAAVATMASYCLMFLFIWGITKDYIKFNSRYLKIRRILIASLIMGTIVYYINPQVVLTKIITIIGGAVIYALLLFVFRVFDRREVSVIKSMKL